MDEDCFVNIERRGNIYGWSTADLTELRMTVERVSYTLGQTGEGPLVMAAQLNFPFQLVSAALCQHVHA